MSSNLNNLLSQAYGLIEADQHDEAVALLKPVLADTPNNADAWWLYAHAVTNPDDARASLETVLNLDPNYPEAQRLLDMLDEASAGGDIDENPLMDMSLQPIRTIPDLPEEMPEGDDELPDFDREFVYAKESSRSALPWVRIVALVLLFLFALIAALFLSQSAFAPAETATPEAIVDSMVTSDVTQEIDPLSLTATALLVDQSLDLIGETATAILTDASATAAALDTTATDEGQGGGAASIGTQAAQAAATPTQEVLTGSGAEVDLAAIRAAFGDETQVSLDTTSSGDQLALALCSEPAGIDLRQTLRGAVETLVEQSDALTPDVSTVVFRLVDCENRTTWRTLTAEIADVFMYADGGLDADGFEARLEAE